MIQVSGIQKQSLKAIFMVVVLLLSIELGYGQVGDSLTLDKAIEGALNTDDWLIGNQYRENALRAEAVYAGQLPDPKMMVSLMNLPVNSLSFDQEPMTQFRVGVTQSFPRGDSLALSRQQKMQESEVNPYLREERIAAVTLRVTQLWLDSYLTQESIKLINIDRNLFEQLVEITDSRYRNAAGPARQQDVIRAEVELTRLDDRLSALQQKLENSRQQLAQWLPYELVMLSVASELPEFVVPNTYILNLKDASEVFSQHPQVKALDKRIDASETGVALARQSYKPGFSVGASYGYRDDGPSGPQRDDFISLELSYDLPLFTEKRQKPRVEAASYRSAAIKTEKVLAFKQLFAAYQQTMTQLFVLEERKALFDDTLLVQMTNLTEATLTAYTADEGDFEEVMRAYISELNAKIDVLGIEIERLKNIAQLNYLLTSSHQ